MKSKSGKNVERMKSLKETGSSWLNCALQDDEAVYWVSLVQQWLVLGGTESV